VSEIAYDQLCSRLSSLQVRLSVRANPEPRPTFRLGVEPVLLPGEAYVLSLVTCAFLTLYFVCVYLAIRGVGDGLVGLHGPILGRESFDCPTILTHRPGTHLSHGSGEQLAGRCDGEQVVPHLRYSQNGCAGAAAGEQSQVHDTVVGVHGRRSRQVAC
jgi:hypothetical protein